MITRSVLMEGNQIYRHHRITQISHDLRGGRTIIEVASRSAEGDEHEMNHWYDLELTLGATVEDLEDWLVEQPFFAEYEDPAITEIAELGEKIARALSVLTDEQAQQVVDMFPEWVTDKAYAVGDRVKYDGKLYKCAQAHTSQSDWTPDVTPALWTPLAAEDADDDPTTVPVWVQPTGAEDAYNTGDRVLYPDAEGTVYESTIDGNVWSPVDYPSGWTMIS